MGCSGFIILSHHLSQLPPPPLENAEYAVFPIFHDFLQGLSFRGLCSLKSPCASWAVVDFSFYHIIFLIFRCSRSKLRNPWNSVFSAIYALVLLSRGGVCPLKLPCASWAAVDLSFFISSLATPCAAAGEWGVCRIPYESENLVEICAFL